MIEVKNDGPKVVSTGENATALVSSMLVQTPRDPLEDISSITIPGWGDNSGSGLELSVYQGDGAGLGYGQTTNNGVVRKESNPDPVVGGPFNNTTTRLKNPITGNVKKNWTSLGLEIGKMATKSLWVALLCGLAPIDPFARQRIKFRIDLSSLWLRSTGCSAWNLIDFIVVKNNRPSFNADLLRKRLNDVTQNSLNTLDHTTRGLLVDNLRKRQLGKSTSVANIDGTEVKLNHEDIYDVEKMANLIDDSMGTRNLIEIFDREAEAALVETLVVEAVRLGIPEAIQAIIDRIQDEETKKSIVGAIMTKTISEGYFDFLKVAAEIIGGSKMLELNPNIIDLALKNYVYKGKSNEAAMLEEGRRILEILNSVNINWFRNLRRTQGSGDQLVEEWVNNLSPFISASEDARKIFLILNDVLNTNESQGDVSVERETVAKLQAIAMNFNQRDMNISLRFSIPRFINVLSLHPR